jgi:hypothetical protein
MTEKLDIALRVIAILLVGFVPWDWATAQSVPPASLENQLKERYKLTRTGSDSTGVAIVEPGTVLAIRKGGILGVPPASATVAPAIFKDGELLSPNSPAGNATRFLPAGEKVYVTKIEVYLKSSKVAFTIIECDSCNGAQKPSFYKSGVVFQFPKDYLTGAALDQIEDVINQVFSETPPTEATPLRNQPVGSAQGFSNDDVIKLVRAKLPDSIVIKKIKSSACDFDTSPDALIKLKGAGVSDAVLQVMVEAPPLNPPESGGNSPPMETGTNPQPAPTCGNYDDCIRIAKTLIGSAEWDRALARLQEASRIDASKGDAWAEIGYVNFRMGQYDDAVAMWDKALQLGATLSAAVCHLKTLCGDTGIFSMSLKEVSFINKQGEKELAAAPAEVTSEGALAYGNGQAYFLNVRSGGKNNRFFYLPKVAGCGPATICPEPGPTQQKVFADYVHAALVRMAAGDLGSLPKTP